jgi:hypothetical protein
MKKYLLGIVAIVLAVSFSAFTAMPKVHPKQIQGKTTTYFWFNVDLSNVESGAISDNDAEFITTTTDDPNPPMGSPTCGGSRYYCLVNFTNSTKVASSGSGYHIVSSQTPDNVSGLKGSLLP